jgi:hypothetical protein
MRPFLAPLVLTAALPALAQGVEKHWYFDLHSFGPTFEGRFQDHSGSNPVDVDFKNDLGLEKDKAKLGFGLEYQGPRFGLEFSRDEEDYKGAKVVTRQITINGQTFNASTLVHSNLKAVNNTLNWTIRCLTWPQFWIGLDLGARATQLELNANGTDPITGLAATAHYKTTLPVPQVGPSLGFEVLENRVIARAYYHFLTYKGCTYKHPGADLRAFPVSWLGIRVFTDGEHFKVPRDSVNSDVEANLDRTGTGIGVVLRY